MDTRAEFSAEIRLDLLVNGQTIPLAKVGPNYAVLRDRQEIAAGQSAVLIMSVDGREHRWEIVLEHGVVPFDQHFTYRVKRYPKQLSLFSPLH